MWIAKFKLKHEGDIFTERTRKFHVEFYAYPITHYLKGGRFLFLVIGFLEGKEDNKKKFFLDIKKDKRIEEIEQKEDYISILIHYPNNEIVKSDMKTFYDPSITHVEPILNSIDGYEHWTVASFEKKNLTKLITSAQRIHNGKLLSIQKKKINELYIVKARPLIPPQQKLVIQTAFKEGYYSYPRKIEIKQLAKILNISYSTCQEHLRKAEIALLPSMIKKL